MGFVRKIGRAIDDTVHAVLEDPLQAIVTVGAMAMGVPPVWAGAIGGAAGAAEHGTNILEGAALGGITGYVGGAAGGAAAEAGAGQILAGAAGGAAAGATGAALTGNDIVGGALTGGIMGGGAGAIASYVNPQTGNSTYTYDDGSTITKAPDGSVVGSTPSNEYGSGAPVIDLSPGGNNNTGGGTTPVVDNGGVAGPVRPPVDLKSTGYSDSEAGVVYNGPNGPEVVLESGKTVLLSDYQAAIDSGNPISVDGNMVTDFKVEVGGAPRYAGQTGAGSPPEGYDVARPEDVFGPDDTNNGQNPWKAGTYLDPETNTWFTPKTPPAGTGDGYNPSSYVAPVTVNPDGSTTTVNWNGSITTAYADGTTVVSNPDGSSVVKDTSGHTTINDGHTGGTGGGGTGGTGTGGTGTGTGTGAPGPTGEQGPGTGDGTTYTYSDGSSITIHPDGTATSTPPTTTTPGGTTTTPGGTTTTPGGTVTTPDGTTTTPGGTTTPTGWTPTPVTPIFPIVVPPKTPVVTPPGTTTVTPTDFTKLEIPTGLNPGFMAPTPFYQTTSPVQSQFYWGPHSYQEGPTFNAQQYNTVPTAPKTPWGIQEMAPVAKPQDIVDYINSPEYQAQFVSGPVVPTRG